MFIIHVKIAGDDNEVSFEVESMVRGYHCYSTIGEEFPCKLELSNPEDRFAVAVCQCEIIFVGEKDDCLPSYRCRRIFY